MFTNPSTIHCHLLEIGFRPLSLEYIDTGVMTDKYWFESDGVKYIVRCFPPDREWLAETEFRYLQLFQQKSIKAPSPACFSVENGILVYEMLEGEALGTRFADMSNLEQDTLCLEIKENYKLISAISCDGFGAMLGYKVFSNSSWKDFLDESIGRAIESYNDSTDLDSGKILNGLRKYSDTITCYTSKLVWSDLSADNIIVGEDGHLAGFIDFEGLMGGDPMLGLGYFIAHEHDCLMIRKLCDAFEVSLPSVLLDFYSIIRLLRLIPYLSNKLPNGTERDDISSYLPYSYELTQNLWTDLKK